jgi:hypothetical protein
MRKNLWLVGLLTILAASYSFAAQNNGPELEFTKLSHETGILYTEELSVVQLSIEFYNSGDAPLILNQVRACCGTRVTQWPRHPINPGDKAIINIEFRPNPVAHVIKRTVTVISNSISDPTAIFRINGEVVEGKSPSS